MVSRLTRIHCLRQLTKEKDPPKAKPKPSAINMQQLSLEAELEEGLLSSPTEQESKQEIGKEN